MTHRKTRLLSHANSTNCHLALQLHLVLNKYFFSQDAVRVNGRDHVVAFAGSSSIARRVNNLASIREYCQSLIGTDQIDP